MTRPQAGRARTSGTSGSTTRRSPSTTSACARRSTTPSTRTRSCATCSRARARSRRARCCPARGAPTPRSRRIRTIPQRAKKLLAEAGYPNGFTTTLWVPESGSGMQAPVAMSTVMQSNLKAVGVNVTLQTMEWGAYLDQAPLEGAGALRAVVDGGHGGPRHGHVPAAPLEPVDARRPEPRALQERALRRAAASRRASPPTRPSAPQLYREAQRILVDDAPWVFVDHEIQIAAFAKRVQGFKLHPSFDLRVETISLK